MIKKLLEDTAVSVRIVLLGHNSSPYEKHVQAHIVNVPCPDLM